MSSTRLLIGATFTATPLAALLQQHGVAEVGFTPYNQLLQALVGSEIAPDGSTVLLLRVADLLRRERGTPDEQAGLLAQRLGPWLDALRAFGGRQQRQPCLLVVPSPALIAAGGALAEACRAAEQQLQALAGCRVLRWPDFLAGAPELRQPFDPVADKLGHVPFSTECFAALAGWLAARLREEATPGAVAAEAEAIAIVAADPLQRFFERLQLSTQCRPLAEGGLLAEAARLSHTAATFHMTTRSSTEAALREQLAHGTAGAGIEVSDRFGRYGFGGFVLGRRQGGQGGQGGVSGGVTVTEFVLNCVVLGKQVEHAVLLGLAQAALQHGCRRLGFAFQPQEANQPAVDFLRSLGAAAGAEQGEADGCLELRFDPARLAQAVRQLAKAPEAVAASAAALDFAPLFAPVAADLEVAR